jgi:hypothetical protein
MVRGSFRIGFEVRFRIFHRFKCVCSKDAHEKVKNGTVVKIEYEMSFFRIIAISSVRRLICASMLPKIIKKITEIFFVCIIFVALTPFVGSKDAH